MKVVKMERTETGLRWTVRVAREFSGRPIDVFVADESPDWIRKTERSPVVVDESEDILWLQIDQDDACLVAIPEGKPIGAGCASLQQTGTWLSGATSGLQPCLMP